MNPHADSVQQPSDLLKLARAAGYVGNHQDIPWIAAFAASLLAAEPSQSGSEADLIAKLQAGIDDPMWANHFEINKRTAAKIIAALSRQAPAAPAEALSEERLYDLADSGEANPDAGGWGPKFDFLAFARLVERAHGIGAAPTPAEPAKTEAKCLTCNGRGTVGMPNVDELPCPDCPSTPLTPEAEPVQCALCGVSYGWHDHQCPNAETAEPVQQDTEQATPSGEDTA